MKNALFLILFACLTSGADLVPQVRSAQDSDLKPLNLLSDHYQSAASISMKVSKTLKLGLLGQERKSSGDMWMSKGRLRMELAGSEKTLLVINKKDLWVVTFPSAEFKDAAVQVIKGETSSKKARSQAMAGLLMHGGFLKYFKPTGVQTLPSGELQYFMQPLQDSSDFKRAQMTVSKDQKKIVELRFWDDRDNETSLAFSDVVFGKKVKDSFFKYVPPSNADVMNL
jgi:outer membrane lipoprotein-sorting protein